MERHNQQTDYVIIDDGKVEVNVTAIPHEKDGFINVSIPAFDLMFSTKNPDKVQDLANRLVKVFIEEEMKAGHEKFAMTLKKLGWQSPDFDALFKSALINKKLINGKIMPSMEVKSQQELGEAREPANIHQEILQTA
ncbi:MAG: hypothetical protein L6Q78_10885 [Bacteroidia bacterium]|nr:hypothetical protein [Bacteroidia bacterium]